MTLTEDSLRSDQVRRNFTRHAEEYECYARVQRLAAARLLTLLPATVSRRNTLEVGCGTGLLSRLFLQQATSASLVLSDLAQGMCKRARTEFRGLPVIAADAAALPFAAHSFELVLSSSVYQWVDHLPQAFAELHRVLKPGGTILIALFGERTLFELRQAHAAALNTGLSHSQGFPDIAQLTSALDGLFEIQTLERIDEVEWHQDVPHLLRGLKAIGAQNASRQRPPGLVSRHLMQRMYDCYTQAFALEGRIPATYEVLYLLAHKS